MKGITRYLAVTSLMLGFATQSLASPVFTDWTHYFSSNATTNGTAFGTLAGSTNVSFSGNVVGSVLDGSSTAFSNTSWFTSALARTDVVWTQGGNLQDNEITFNSAVLNPILHVYSLGRGGTWGSSYFQNWTFNQSFTILSSRLNPPSETGGSGFRLTELPGNVLHGEEGHGSIQFSGSVTSIKWRSDIAEQFSGFQVGFDASVPVPPTFAPESLTSAPDSSTAVPEPSTLVLLVLGLAGIGTRRRQTR